MVPSCRTASLVLVSLLGAGSARADDVPPPPEPPVLKVPPPLPPPVPPPRSLPEPRCEPDKGRSLVRMSYTFTDEEVWPAYSAGKRLALTAALGFATAAVRPAGATGRSASMIGVLRAGYAIGDRGFEVIVDAGGNMVGPPALFAAAGARWMFTPTLRREGDKYAATSWYIGPEVVLGTLITLAPGSPGGPWYGAGTAAQPMAGGSIVVGGAYLPYLTFDLSLGNLRVVPTSQGAIVLLGVTLGVSVRI